LARASLRDARRIPGNNVRQKAGLNREILDTSPGMMMALHRPSSAAIATMSPAMPP
jgi:hypothetical protein